MLIVIRVYEFAYSLKVGSMNIVFSTIPKVKEKGVWAILRCKCLFPTFTVAFSTSTKGFLISIRAVMTPLRAESTILPLSLTTMQSIVNCHTNLPVRTHKDSGSRALLPRTIFSNNLVI